MLGTTPDAVADEPRGVPAAGRQVVPLEIDGRDVPVVVLAPSETPPERGFPLVVSLHGQSVDGGRECDHNWRPQRGVVIACPTEASAPWRGPWGERVVLETTRALLSRWRLDPDRVFLSGASTGGIGAWRYAIRRPDRFAGVIPRAGMPPLWTDAVLSNLLTLGAYIVHGLQDTTIRPDADRRAAERLHELGGDVTLRELDGAHTAFPAESAAIAAWIGRRRRNPAPARFRYALSPNLGDLPDRVHWVELGGRSGLPIAFEARIDRAAGTVDVDFQEGWVEHLRVLFDDRLVDTSRPVVVRVDGVERSRGMVERSDAVARRLVAGTADPGVAFDRVVSVDLEVPESAERSRPAARPDRHRRRPRHAAKGPLRRRRP
jgi:pimeloyl-ACP methyl ester carboxylesterase